MVVSFDQVGALAANATTTTLALVAPANLDTNDILIGVVLNKDNQVDTFPTSESDGIGAWTKIVELNNTTAQRITVAWARVTNGANASGNTVAVTKPTDNNVLFCGCISSWKGCLVTATPIDASTPTTSANTSSDTVTYATFDPTETTAFVLAIGVYNEDQTTGGSITGTDPTFSKNVDLESGTGTDGSVFIYSGSSTGAATGARSHSTTSTNDAISIGCLLGLIAAPAPVGGYDYHALAAQSIP